MPAAAAQPVIDERARGGAATGMATGAADGPRWPGWATIALFLLPAFAIYAVFVLYPILQSIRYSLHEWSGISPGFEFVGLGNYRTLIGDDVFWKALRNNLILVVASIAIQLPIGLGLALLAEQRLRGWRVFRTVWFLPLLMSTVAIGLLWNYIYDPTFGLINTALHTFGLDSWQRGWLGEKETALGSVIAVICWQYIPFYMVLFIAGLTTIPADLLEAARLDGASGWTLFRSVTLPLLRPVIRTSAILSLIGSLKYFDLIYVMTGGGPGDATQLMATYMYENAFTQFDMGYGSAIAVALFLIAFVITGLVLYLDQFRAGREE
ncbi:MAG: carbohydrate ABC transporter permease [Chloroflexota bacterium]